MNADPRLARALLSLEGLAIGDMLGDVVYRVPLALHDPALLATVPWRWTDDTAMAASVVENLARHGRIEQDSLALAFGERYLATSTRGYGLGAMDLLAALAEGKDWRIEAAALFDGGSYGNGGGMRAAPIGAWYAGDPKTAAEEGAAASAVTHAHPEGQLGGAAVAAAAALAAEGEVAGVEFLDAILETLAEGEVTRRIRLAREIPADGLARAFFQLGTGHKISAQDTVPFCLWAAAHNLGDLRAALWLTAQGGGDVDTTCAIVGGIVAAGGAKAPVEWRALAEPLPAMEI